MTEKSMPTGKLGRALSGGRTAAKVGGQVLGYYAKRPFLSAQKRRSARDRAARDGARALFQGLGLLKGTALKMAQLLSLELDVLPEAVCRELSKSYHQVPPINQALVRKVVQNALGRPPEALFKRFDLQAFAAASLGQVHFAVDAAGRDLAVKIQYPGIAATINSDVGLLRRLLATVVEDHQLTPTLDEIAARLKEEVDYLQEADNLAFFAGRLAMDAVCIPEVLPDLTARTVLTTTLLPGKPLNLWLKDNPGQNARDQVAQTLNDMMVKGLYELQAIHADPNPGNFIVADDLSVGLVDFGCVKRVDAEFIDQYRQLARAVARHDKSAHIDAIIRIGLLADDADKAIRRTVAEIADVAGEWFSRMFAAERFDFSAHPGYIGQGQAVMRQYHHLYRHLQVNPEFIFLDRTRYGLLRIFEMMGARVRFRNPYEWQGVQPWQP
jgi:predicted unusual protein kinase regulating ubiquinone biosynthesis (AarF/ABC1/UbiB family)